MPFDCFVGFLSKSIRVENGPVRGSAKSNMKQSKLKFVL